jgi:hypothetical protein
MLRSGLSFSEDALRIASGFKPKAYFIFSFDLVPIAEMNKDENLRVPEEICLLGGAPGYREPGIGRSVFSVSAFMDVVRPATPKEGATESSAQPRPKPRRQFSH